MDTCSDSVRSQRQINLSVNGVACMELEMNRIRNEFGRFEAERSAKPRSGSSENAPDKCCTEAAEPVFIESQGHTAAR
jgi:uncharacterized small protein (DUF1192 family)